MAAIPCHGCDQLHRHRVTWVTALPPTSWLNYLAERRKGSGRGLDGHGEGRGTPGHEKGHATLPRDADCSVHRATGAVRGGNPLPRVHEYGDTSLSMVRTDPR